MGNFANILTYTFWFVIVMKMFVFLVCAENQPGTASSRANGKEQLSEGLTERKGYQ